MENFEKRYLKAIKDAYEAVKRSSPQSNEKLKVLHGWIRSEVQKLFGKDFEVIGLDKKSKKELKIKGYYYNKNVDIAVTKNGRYLGVISVKFVISNYNQNKINLFEQQLGETVNLRKNNIVFGSIFILTEPIPYYTNKGEFKKSEHVSDSVVEIYDKLSQSHTQLHAPDAQCLAIFKLINEESKQKRKIVRKCVSYDLPNISEENFAKLHNNLDLEIFLDHFKHQILAKDADPNIHRKVYDFIFDLKDQTNE